MPNRLRTTFDRVLSAPLAAWLLVAFAAAYMLFFIQPVFLTPGAIKFFRYLPAMDPIGADLAETLSFSHHWISTGTTPYILSNAYPPLTAPLFALLLPLDFARAYMFVTLASLAAYATMTVGLPLLTRTSRRIPSAFVAIVLTGLFSYGFQFELERGQFNVLAVMLCLVAVWIYHHHTRYRLLAFVLFALSVQMKLYPLVFALMLVEDWRAWRENLRRLLLLALANLALLFVLGPGIFLEFAGRLGRASGAPPLWIYNHSVRAFVSMAVERIAQRGWVVPDGAVWLPEAGLYLILVICPAVMIARFIRSRQTGLSLHLLLACTVLALVVPPVSNDYTLAVLAAPMALLVLQPADDVPADGITGRNLVALGSRMVLAAAYVCTLFAHPYKPHTLWLENNFPAMLAILIAVTALSLSSPTAPSGEVAPVPGTPDHL
jgi:hypothetical protein